GDRRARRADAHADRAGHAGGAQHRPAARGPCRAPAWTLAGHRFDADRDRRRLDADVLARIEFDLRLRGLATVAAGGRLPVAQRGALGEPPLSADAGGHAGDGAGSLAGATDSLDDA